MGDSKISLMIFGTRLNISGWEPLIMLNNPPFPTLSNIGIAGVGENPKYYTLRIAQNYTQYTLVYNPKFIKAHGKGRDGALKVSISIPKGYKLDSNKSPYNVLIDIQRALEKYALTPIVGKQGAFEFKANFPSDEIFTQVLNQYRLIEKKMPHRPMSSTSDDIGMILANDSQLDMIFRDSQYPEFSPYKEIAIAQFGESDNIIKNLDIPRKAKYEVFANNINITSHLVTYNYGYNDDIVINTLEVLGKDKRAYDGDILKFTVAEALNRKYSHLKYYHLINVDYEEERILVKLDTPTKKKVLYRIVLKGCDNNDVFDYLKAEVNAKARNISASHQIELIGEELIGRPLINITADGKKYKVDGEITFKGTDIYIPVKEVPKPKEDNINRVWGNSFDATNSCSNGSKKTNVIEFKLILEDSEDIKDSTKPYRVRFHNDEKSFSQYCEFRQLRGKKGYYTDTITIPTAWEGSYYVALRTDSVKMSSKQRISHSLTPNTKEVKITEDETTKLTYRDRMSKSCKLLLRALICLIILAIVACASIWTYSKFPHNEDSNIEETKQHTSDNNIEEAITDMIQEYELQLHGESISFDDIKGMNSWITGNSAKLDSIEEGIQFKKKIDVYMQLINVIQGPNNNSKMEKIRDIAQSNRDLIEGNHYTLLQGLWSTGINSNGQEIPANSKQVNTINSKLKGSAHTYKTFQDLPSCKNTESSTHEASGSSSTSSTTAYDGGYSPTGKPIW